MAQKSDTYNYTLDLWRFMLILWIVLFHYTSGYKEGIIPTYFPVRFGNGGPVGVTCFFVISGFFMGHMLIRDITFSWRDYMQYIKKRYLRFFPIYTIAVILIFLWLQLWPVESRMTGWLDFTVNTVFIWHPGFDYVDGAHWFLAVLILIQFFTAFLMFFNPSTRYVIGLMIYLLLCIACIDEGFPRHGIYILLASEVKLLFGIMLFLLYRKRTSTNLLMAIFGGGILLIMENSLVLPAVLVVTCILIFINVPVPTNFKRLAKFLGSISFTWYLVHNNIGFSLITFLLPEGSVSLVWLLIPLLLTLLVSSVVNQFSNKIFSRIC